MAAENTLELAITGVSGVSGTIYVPIMQESDLAMGYVEVTASKIQNDSEKDITTYLSTFKLFDDLSYGAWAKFHKPDANRYFEPVFTAGTSTALAWTLDKDAPLLPGAATVDQSSANYAFKEFELFKGKLFGLDTKYYRVWRNDSETWKYYAGSGTGWTATVKSGNVTGATNASPIVITSTAHGLSSGDIVTIASVGGNTAANSTNAIPVFYITKLSNDTFSLYSDSARTVAVAGSGAYTSGGTWKADAAGIRYEPTEIINVQLSATNYVLVGQTTGYARRSNDLDTATPTWSDFTDKDGTATAAQHFELVGVDLYYSKNNKVYNRTESASPKWNVGDSNTDVNRLLWWRNMLVITKPEGVWIGYPNNNSLQRLIKFTDRDEDNGKVLLIHKDNVYWNQGENWVRWDGYSAPVQAIAKFDGNDNRIFYEGKVRGAVSDGNNLYLVYRVITSDATPYYNDFLVVQKGDTLGYHPVFVASSTTTPPSYYLGGIFFGSQKLRYSLGTAATATTGYLLTDGKVPMSATGSPYTWSVGITTGWFDAGREWLTKWFKEAKVTTRDINSTGTGTLTLSYQRWTDSGFTTFPTTLTGTNDNATLTPTAGTVAGGDAFNLAAGITAGKINFKLVLSNSGTSTQKEKMFYVRSLHLVGLPFYTPALQASVRVPLLTGGKQVNRNNKRQIDSDTLKTYLQTAIVQAAPVSVTFPDGTVALMKMLPGGQGIRYGTASRDNGEPQEGTFSFDLREMV